MAKGKSRKEARPQAQAHPEEQTDMADTGGEGEPQQSEEEKFERWSSHFSSHVEVEVLGRTLRLRQDPSEEMLEETGSTVWDIGRVLALFLNRDRDLSRRIKGKRIIELGSGLVPLPFCLFLAAVPSSPALPLPLGCGLLGIALGLMGAHVTITDVPAVRYLLEENVRANAPAEGL